MSKSINQSHLILWITWSIVVSFAGGVIAAFTLAPYSPMQNLLFQVFTAELVTGLTVLSIHAHLDGWHIPAAGFVMLSISQGIFASTIGIKQNEVNYDAGVTGIIFMLPALVMICYYGIL